MTDLSKTNGPWRLENLPNLPFTLPARASLTFDLTYSPTTAASNQAAVAIESNDADEPVVEVQLTGQGIPDFLRVTPAADFVSQGAPGGPFSPSATTYVLSNASSAAISWAVRNSQAWLDVSPTNGTLAVGQSASVTVGLTAAANSLAAGQYTDTLTFSNFTSGAVQRRGVTLSVRPDYFTELFDTSSNDLAFKMWTFTPDGSAAFYSVCREVATNFPTDPTGGTSVTLSDDSYAQVTLTGTNTVAIYGRRTNVFFIGSNGYLTLNSGDTTLAESFTSHFNRPRISACFDDLNPSSGGTVSRKQTSDRVAVTFSNVREYGTTATVSFQIEMFSDGRIRITYLGVGITDGLAGLSAGLGVPAGFTESDLTGYPICPPPDNLVVTPQAGFVSLGAPGGPFAPPSMDYTLRNAGTNVLNWAASATQPWLTANPAGGGLAPGATTSATILINTNAQALGYGTYTACVIFSNALTAFTETRCVQLTIAQPALSISDAAVSEGNTGLTNLVFQVSLLPPSAQTVTVAYATTNGTALAGSDYVAASGTLTFAPAQTNRTIAVSVVGETNVEPNETFFVNLSNPTNAVLARAQGIGTILNDDGCTLQTNYVASQTFLDRLDAATMGVAFDGANYWSVSGNSTSGNRLARYDAAGNLLATYAPGLDFRSIFTDAAGTVYARTYASGTIYRQTAPGVFSTHLLLSGGSLNSQSSVVLNGSGTEFIAMNNGVVSRWQPDGTYLGLVTLVGFGSVGGETTSPQNRGVAAAGNYWLTYNGNGILSVWDATGMRVAQATLQGVGATFDSAYSFSYCNGKVFVVDSAGGTWRGYEVCAQTTPLPPTITTQPVSQTVRPGTNATFCVTATGTSPLSYQWRKDGTNLVNGGRITGATSACLTISSAVEADSGQYSVGVTNAYGSAVSSNATLLVSALDHFAWSAITSPQTVGAPFPVTLTAQDEVGRVVSNFTGGVTLSGWVGGGLTTNTILGSVVHTVSGSGTYTLGFAFTPTNNLTVTHVRSYSGTKVSIWTDAGVLLVSRSVSGSAGVWTETPLASPLALSAGTTYRVGFYTAGGTYYYREDRPSGFPNGTLVDGYYYGTTDGFPTNFYGADRVIFLCDLRYTIGSSLAVPISPSVSGNFANGFWTGDITVQQPATNMYLLAADSTGRRGTSNPFDVLLANDLSVAIADQPDPVAIGGYLTNTITVANSGPTAATGVTATNFLPASVTFVSATASPGSCVLVGSRVECAVGTLAGGATATIRVVTAANAAGQITNLVTVGRAEADAYAGNNSAAAVTTVAVPSLSIADASVREGNSGTTNAVFTVSLLPAPVLPVTVNYATSNGTAQANSDYLPTSGVLNFTLGDTNKTIVVPVIGDTNVEPNETFFVTLSSPVNAALTRAQAMGTIQDDDVGPFFDDFEPNIDLAQWSAFGGEVGSTVVATNYGGSISSPNSLWFGAETNRFATTRTINTTGGGMISFYIRLADGSAWPWEQVDALPSEGVVLEYSINGGSTWTVMGNYDTTAYYVWTAVSLPIPAGAQAPATQFRWRQLSHSGSCCDHWALDDVSVGPRPPTIITQPANATVTLGGTATFSVGASGSTPLSYQWRRYGTNLIGSGRITGVTSNVLTIASVQTNDAGPYSVLVTNLLGAALSSSAVLTVQVPQPPAEPCCPVPTNRATLVSVHTPLSWNSEATNQLGVIDLGKTNLVPYTANTIGNGDRSVTVAMNSSCVVSSLGIRLQIGAPTVLTVTIRSVVGTTRGAVLATASRSVTATPLGFVDVPIAFAFNAGQLYDLAFDVAGGWGNPSVHTMEFYDFNNPTLNPTLGYDVGPFKVLDGAMSGGYGNSVMPHVRASGSVGSAQIGYTVYFGTNVSSLRTIASNLTQTTCSPGLLAFNTTYYWQVVASNAVGSVTGAVWQFTTALDEVRFASASYSVAENGNSALISVLRENPAGGPVSVHYATTNGTATAGADYTAVSGTLNFPAGVLSTNFSVPIINDSLSENNETVLLSLSQVTPNVFLGSNAVLTIMDDDRITVAVFDDSRYVDTTSGGTGAESDNVQASLTNRGFGVVTFTNIVAAAAANSVLLFPEQEIAALAPALTVAGRSALSNFVASGGLMIVHGSGSSRDAQLVNTVLGTTIASGSVGSTFNLMPAAVGTHFADDPATVPNLSACFTWQTNSLPPGSKSIYESVNASAVAWVPFGTGKVIFLGWDWYNAYPIGTADGGWLTVLESAVLERGPITPRPVIVAAGTALLAEGCGGGNGAIDPGETVTLTFGLRNAGSAAASNVVVTLLPTGGVTAPSAPQNYGMLLPGGPAVSNAFTFTATGACGGTLVARLQVQDGDNSLGALDFSFRLGVSTAALVENFDSVAAPTLPAGWTASLSGAGAPWATTTAQRDTSPNAVFAPDPSTTCNNSLTSPSFFVPATGAQLSFRHAYSTESCCDGGRLEISIAGGAFTDILTAGGSFVTNGYSTSSGWYGTSAGFPSFITTVVNLPASASGRNAALRWRFTADSSVAGTGWYVDTVSVGGDFICCSPPTIITQPASQGVRPGTNVTFCVTATGSLPLNYQWRKNGTNLVNGGRITGATSTCLTISTVVEADSGQYSVSIANTNGSLVSSNATLLVSALDHFAWSAIPSPQTVGAPFPVTITAQDEVGRVVSNFTGSVTLSGWMGGGLTTNTILGSVVHTASGSGTYTLGYAFTPTNNLTITHMRSYSGTKVSIWTDAGVLLVSRSVSGSAGVWTETPLAAPLALSAGTTYRVGFYTAGGSYYYREDRPSGFPNGTLVDGYYYGTADGFPTNFYSADRVIFLCDLRYTIGSSLAVPISPTASGNFANGLWSGNLTVQQPATNMYLVAADSTGHRGTSNPFDVRPSPPVIVAQPTNQIVPVGGTATFCVTASGSEPLLYLWSRNGAPIAGATAACYSITNVQRADSGSQFSCRITNNYGSAVSSSAMLIVNRTPIADASATPDLVVSANGVNARVVLDGSRSSDPDGDVLRYLWFRANAATPFATGVVAVVVLPVGTHPISLVVSDGLAADTNRVSVAVLTAADAIQRLIDIINQSDLPHPRPLIASLEAAQAAVNRGNSTAAINELQAFQSKVRVQVAPRNPVLADTLIRGAQQVIDALASGGAAEFAVQLHSLARQPDGKMHFKFAGSTSQLQVVEASTNLVDWEMIGVLADQGNGLFEFEDANATKFPGRFYRVKQLPR